LVHINGWFQFFSHLRRRGWKTVFDFQHFITENCFSAICKRNQQTTDTFTINYWVMNKIRSGRWKEGKKILKSRKKFVYYKAVPNVKK
jgi:hypothetical protein